MYIMNLKDEFEEAKDWVDNKLDLNIDKDVNLLIWRQCLNISLGSIHNLAQYRNANQNLITEGYFNISYIRKINRL